MSVSSIIELCISKVESQAELDAISATFIHAMSKRSTELGALEEKRALATVVEQLCDASKYPAYAAFHDVLRSATYDRTKFKFHAENFYFSFYGGYYTVAMTNDGSKYLRLDSAGLHCKDNERVYPTRVIDFLYAMQKAGVSMLDMVEQEMAKAK